jgi:hypothetical protein
MTTGLTMLDSKAIMIRIDRNGQERDESLMLAIILHPHRNVRNMCVPANCIIIIIESMRIITNDRDALVSCYTVPVLVDTTTRIW